MYNENEPMAYDEIVSISEIKLPIDKLIDMNRIRWARRREYTMGIVVSINEKNHLVTGHEWLILAVQRGQSEIKVKRKGPLTMKSIT
jgi:hypothetical protein